MPEAVPSSMGLGKQQARKQEADSWQSLHSLWPQDREDRYQGNPNTNVIDLEAEESGEHWPEKGKGKWERQGIGGASGSVEFVPLADQTNVQLRQKGVACPVCNKTWEWLSNGELNKHVDACLQNSEVWG